MRRRLLKSNYFIAVLLACGVVCGVVASKAYADTTIRANICGTTFTVPTITEPMPGTETENTSISVSGTGEPGMLVTIMRGSSNIGSTTVASDGSYVLQVPLIVGDNVLQAHETDACGQGEDSGMVTVRRKELPPTPPSPSPSPSGQTQQQSPSAHGRNGSLPRYLSGSGLLNPEMSAEAVPTYGERPFITNIAQNKQVDSSRLWVEGKATPGSVVTIYVNGVEVARVVASEDGTFGVMVSLQPGKNTLQVESELNGVRRKSDGVDVYYLQHVARLTVSHVRDWWLIGLSAAVLLLVVVWSLYRQARRKEQV